MNRATLWHPTRTDAAQSGIRRYERAIDACSTTEWQTKSVWRPSGTVRGATAVSWLVDYRTHGADVIHATAATAGVPALWQRDVPLVVTSHGPIPVRYPELQQDWTTKAQWRLQPRVLDRADVILANSDFTKRELIDVYGLPASKIRVVHLGVDLQRFRPDAGPDPWTFGYHRTKPNVLLLSSNLPQKRMDLARAVIERLAGTVHFVKAGYGEGLSHPAVTNAGYVRERDLPGLYAGADLLFHPSEYESFGLPVVEAMACGTPVVAQGAAAIPEVVGEGGELVGPEYAISAFADAIPRMLASDYGDAPRRQAEQFPWSNTVERTVQVWNDVLNSQ